MPAPGTLPVTAFEHYRLTVQCLARQQVGDNIHHLLVQSVVGAPTRQEFADALALLLAPVIVPLISSKAEYRGVLLQKLLPAPVTPTVTSSDGTAAGSAGTALLPTQVRGIFTKVTAHVARSGRGRCYVPFPDEADNDDTTALPSAGYVGRLADYATLVSGTEAVATAGGGTVNVQWELLSRAGTPTPIVDFRVTQKWATHRSSGSFGRLNSPDV